MKHLLAILAALLLASSAAQAQETVVITPPPTETSSATDREVIRTVPADQRDALDLQPGQVAILDPVTNEWEVTQSHTPTSRTLADLYMEGGYEYTTPITLCLIALLFAAWKAPRWVKEFGLLALIIGFLSMMIGFYSVADLIQETDKPISFNLLCGGLRVAFICPIYGMLVYALSLILRIVLKPRI